MEDENLFAIGELEDDAGVSVVVYRQTILSATREKLPNQFIVEWKFSSVLPNGVPDLNELSEAMGLDKRMRTKLEIEGESLLAFISTGNGYREWYFYCRHPELLQIKFNEVVNGQTLPVQLHAGHDPTWATYQTFTAPFMRLGD